MDAVQRRRLWGYPLAATITGSLLYFGFFREVDADADTLLSSVDVQLRLAAGMPEADRDGGPLAARVELLGKVRGMLETIDRSGMDTAVLDEYWAFLLRLEGDVDGAVARYRRGRSRPDCGPELRDSMVFNEARTLHAADRSDEALEVLAGSREELGGELQVEADLLMASIHRALGRDQRAAELADAVAANDAASAVARVRSGRMLEALGSVERAEAAYERAGEDFGVALYYRAKLKVTQGEADTALELLERAAAAEPAQVARLLDEEAEAWAAVQQTERYQQIGIGSAGGTAAPGR